MVRWVTFDQTMVPGGWRWLLRGVTASDETDLALSWAENNHAEICAAILYPYIVGSI